MNIAIVTSWYPAGAGYVSKAYEKVLSKNNCVFIYARGGKIMKKDPVWDKDNVTWAPNAPNGMRTSHFIRWAKNKKIDFILFNEQRYWKPVIAAKRAGFCIGAYIDYYTQLTIPAFDLYDIVLCNTKRHYSVFQNHKNPIFIPWGTDIKKFKPSNSKNRKLTFLISAGWQGNNMRDRRGSLLALKAFHQVKGNCRLVVFSQVKYEDMTPEWREIIKKDERITLKTGTFDPFPFNEGDIYLYPSRLDGIGLTLPEALSSGLAAITTDSAPMNEFVSHDHNGKLIKVEKHLGRYDGYYWAESICELTSLTSQMQHYVNNQDLVIKHKINARNFSLSKLDWEKNAVGLDNHLIKTLENYSEEPNVDIILLAKDLDNRMAPSATFKTLSAIKAWTNLLFK